MRLAITLIISISISAPTVAQTARTASPVAAPSATCTTLAADLTFAEQNIAISFVEGIGDNSAPRATLRAIREQNALSNAALTIALMRDNRCTMPTRAPRVATYVVAASQCETARLRAPGQQDLPACDRATWQRSP